MAFGLRMINCNHLSLNLIKLMIKIYEALSFAANCRAAENTLLDPGAWNSDVWYNSNCERTFLLKHSQEQNRILWSAFLLIHLKTTDTQNTMVIVTHLDSAIIKQRITLIAWWRRVIMNSMCCLPQSDGREKNRVTVYKAHLTVSSTFLFADPSIKWMNNSYLQPFYCPLKKDCFHFYFFLFSFSCSCRSVLSN